MADEYYERYKHLSHQELYRGLRAGAPHQVDTVADTWASAGDTVSALAATLQADLKRLLPDWTSQGSREYHYRLELIVRYAQTLADEAGAMRTGLTVMASSLRGAQRRAESPSDSAFSVGDLINGVVGASLGRVVPAVERAQAHERMVRLVAKLAADYGVAEHGKWPDMDPVAPIDLPALGVGSGLAAGVGLGASPPNRRDHGHHRDHGNRDHRDHRDHGRRSSSGSPAATAAGHLYHGALGAAVIGGGSGWSQYSRPVHFAGHAIGVDMSVGPHSASGGGSGGSGGSGGGSAGGSGSGSSGSGSASPASGGAGGSSAATGATGATPAAGGAMPMAPLGGAAPAGAGGVASGGAGGAGIGGGGGVTSAERAWHLPDPVDWADPDDDAGPSVLGG